MEKIVSKTKVVESDVSSEMSSSVFPVEVKPKVKLTKKTKSKKASNAKKSTKVEDVKGTAKPKSKTKKTKKVKDPIMKEMNKFRNEVISTVVGSKAPKLTIPPFKLALAAARAEMGLGKKDKNTVETVQKAIELFQNDNSKYLEN